MGDQLTSEGLDVEKRRGDRAFATPQPAWGHHEQLGRPMRQRRRRFLSTFAVATAMAIPMVMIVGGASPASSRPAKGAANAAAKRGKKVASAAHKHVPVPRPRPATAQRVASLSGLAPVAGSTPPTPSLSTVAVAPATEPDAAAPPTFP